MYFSNGQLGMEANLCHSRHRKVYKFTEISQGIGCLETLVSDTLLDTSLICSISILSSSFMLASSFVALQL